MGREHVGGGEIRVGEMERRLLGVKGNLEKLECDTGPGGGVGTREPAASRARTKKRFYMFPEAWRGEGGQRPEARAVGTELWGQGPGHGAGGMLGEGFASASRHFSPYLVRVILRLAPRLPSPTRS